VAGQLVAAAAGVPGACSEDGEPSDRTTTSAICVNGDNVNNYVRMTLLKITFFGKVATSDRRGGQICKMFMSNFLRI